jgi:FtsP/CotA-like multicopper oxidase with cupredoxin domain
MLSVVAALVSVAAFLLAALGLVVVTLDDEGGGGGGGGGGSDITPVQVSLADPFKIDPGDITVPLGAKLLVTNNSTSTVHNLAVEEAAEITTPDLQAGESYELDLSSLEAGTYNILCTIPGHAQAGMVGTLTVTAEGSAGGGSDGESATAGEGGGGTEHDRAHYLAVEEAQNTNIGAFATDAVDLITAGEYPLERGNNVLDPEILPGAGPNGEDIKEFKLVAAITEWEVSPGNVVQAWTYNGTVPGPWIDVEQGDRVRVTVRNDLEVAATDIHFHGITTPFEDDGVSTLTQPYVEPGETHTYEFTAPNRPEAGMYHAHMHGQESVINGLFAMFTVGDVPLPDPGSSFKGRPDLVIPEGVTDPNIQHYPMVLNDAGVIGLSINGKSFPATEPVFAAVGKPLLVTYQNEGFLSHPMHLHHVPQLVVAKDGFALDTPYWVDTVNIAPGERYTVLILPTTEDLNLDDGDDFVYNPLAPLLNDSTPDDPTTLPSAGIWAFHCHILNHAENSEIGLFGMVTALVVVPDDPAFPLPTTQPATQADF